MKEDDMDAEEEEYRTQWEQEGGSAGMEGAPKRARDHGDEEAELPDEVQARLKTLRGE
jgi:hypothetical protein